MPNQTDVDAIVVGAGIAGLYQLYKLRELGLSVQGLEAAPEVGGTWYWNCYPGARVDSQSYIYQYWFSQDLIDEWDWSERFPAREEIERYLNFVADRLDLRKHIRLSTRVTECRWDEENTHWQVTTERGETVTTSVLVSCTGLLSVPNIPPFPDLDKYEGRLIHTARYPRDGLDYAGKRVGVIGVGATGIQVIQTIASEVAELKIFQRTPAFGVAMRNEKFDDEKRNYWRSHAKELERRVHQTFAGFDFDFDHGSWYDHSSEERQAILEQTWSDGSLATWVGTFPEVFSDANVNSAISRFAGDKIREQVDDPVTAEKLVPRNHGFGTYRVPLQNGFYAAFNRDNVQLIDLHEEPIECFTPDGIRTTADQYDLDVVIVATGFDAGTGALTRMNIHGRDGCSLTHQWSQDIRSTLGMQIHGYPNLYTVAAPLAPATAFCNMTTCLQQQVEWISDAIEYARINGYSTMEPSRERQDAWVEHHDTVTAMTLLGNTNSWYTGANVEGKPRRLLSYPGGVGTYRQLCDEVRQSAYEGFIFK